MSEAPRMGRPQMVDEDGVPTRDRILAAALDAIVERGYDAATLSEIAKTAEVSPPAIYNHFGSKAELFVEAARVGVDSLGANEITDPHEMLQVDAPARIRRVRRLLVELHSAALRHPDLDAALADWQRNHVKLWVELGYGTEASARAYYVLVQGLALMDALHIEPDDRGVAELVRRMGDELLR